MIEVKVAKLKKIEEKQPKQKIEEKYSLKNMIIIIMITCIVLTIFYFITLLVVKNNKPIDKENSIVEIDSNKITMGQLLDRKEKEYYVLAIKESLHLSLNTNMNYSELYNNYISSYEQTENSLPIYKIDLDDALNKNYFSEETNITNNLTKLKINNEVLFKIKNNKIEKHYLGSSEILKELKNLSN